LSHATHKPEPALATNCRIWSTDSTNESTLGRKIPPMITCGQRIPPMIPTMVERFHQSFHLWSKEFIKDPSCNRKIRSMIPSLVERFHRCFQLWSKDSYNDSRALMAFKISELPRCHNRCQMLILCNSLSSL